MKYRGKKDASPFGILPAWAADEYMLGRGDTVDPTLEREREQGYLDCTSAELCFGEPRDPLAYIKALNALLRKTGYISG
jgi:hypothetical protein